MIRICIITSGRDAKSEPMIITTSSTELNKKPREKNHRFGHISTL